MAQFDREGACLSSERFGTDADGETAWTVATNGNALAVGGWVRPSDASGVDRALVLKFRQ